MCCFSQPVRHVSRTRVFARHLEDGRQTLVYAMSLEADADLAMVLPLPVPPQPPDDAVEFISLKGQEWFFERLERAFPMYLAVSGAMPQGGPSAAPAPLAIHQVGAFEASFVPGRRDFERLDGRFRLAPAVLDALPGGADWGFAVFKLRSARARQDVHPMAFSFPRRDPSTLFFPTVHVHDGSVPARARFDHTLYAQLGPGVVAAPGWESSEDPLSESLPPASAIVADLGAVALRTQRSGDLPNEDVVLPRPARAGQVTVDRRGRHHHLQLGPGAGVPDAPETFARAIEAPLVQVLDGLRERWSLRVYDDALPLRPATAPAGIPGQRAAPCRVTVHGDSPELGVQSLTLAVSKPPTPSLRKEMQFSFARLLARLGRSDR